MARQLSCISQAADAANQLPAGLQPSERRLSSAGSATDRQIEAMVRELYALTEY